MAQRTARADPSNEAKKPSPAVSTSIPAREERSDRRMVLKHDLTPSAVPELGRALCRLYDVREEDRREDPIERHFLLADLRQETTDLGDDRVTSDPPRLECSTTRAPGILLATKHPVSGRTS